VTPEKKRRHVGEQRLADRPAVLGGEQARPALGLSLDRVGEPPKHELARLG